MFDRRAGVPESYLVLNVARPFANEAAIVVQFASNYACEMIAKTYSSGFRELNRLFIRYHTGPSLLDHLLHDRLDTIRVE